MSKQAREPFELRWERSTHDAFPRDTNLHVYFPNGKARLIGWVRELVHPDTAGFYIQPAGSLVRYMVAEALNSPPWYPTKRAAMRALRTAATLSWINADPCTRELFIRNKGDI